MSTPHADKPLSLPQVAAIELVAEVLAQGELDPNEDDFYNRLCEVTCKITSVTRAVIFRYDSARRRVRAAGSFGVDRSVFANTFFSVESAPLARVALETDRVVESSEDLEQQLPVEYVRMLATTHVVCSPMSARGRWIGVILADRGGTATPMEDGERDLMWILGKTAALASMARVATRQQEKALQLEQRIDLAREIHERVIQRLFGVSLALSGDHELDAEARRRCAEEVQVALADLRRAVQRPLGRSAAQTNTTLAEEIERLAQQHPDVGIARDGDEISVPPALESLAQSVLAEAVRNAHKHATPTRIGVRTASDGDAFVLEVTNDGLGANMSKHPGMGLRLAGFEALQAGGLVEFGRRGADLWQVRLVVPQDEER
jgi:signal transduction histidine kinase